jgi:outer membrane receptor protein involved in Fe transport
MAKHTTLRRAVRYALLASALPAGLHISAAVAQEEGAAPEELIVTGTRITVPGVVSSSPIYSVGAAEIQIQQQPEVEKILRVLPITKPNDGQNVNNGTAGVSTIDLRGLGAQRNLILIDGKRITPYNINGLVDASVIPTALIDRIDIVTGGASAVYGSDAMSGAINFVMKRDFEGVEIDSELSRTDENDGEIRTASLTIGSNVADGRGNVVLGINWTDREGVQLGARPLGTIGIVTEDGSGLDEFLAGEGPAAPPPGCGGTGSVATGGSTTTLPTRVNIAGGAALGQFRDDGTLGADCSVFNFNPFNYYQTPLERFGGTVIGNFEINEHAEPYARFSYSSTNVRQQIAPSGVFGSFYFTPLANPFITDQARGVMIDAAEEGRADGLTCKEGADLAPGPDACDGDGDDVADFANWRDVNGNDIVDEEDYLNIAYRRRTVELGERSTTFDNNAFQFLTGIRGDIVGDWSYDVALQYGESNRTNISAGYTNLTNVGNALDSVDGVTCANGDPSCVPLNLFGGEGAITPEMAAYSGAVATEKQEYQQTIASAFVNGPINAIQTPWAANPISVGVGLEYRKELGETVPDECLKLAPASCLGGAGGNTLPIAGGFDVIEMFGEAIFPIVEDRTGFRSLNLELGYRYSDYDPTGWNDTYKYGLNWRPVDALLVRVMEQKAVRAPNVGELAAPQTTGLDNAIEDPCSVANGNINAELEALCISTGMTPAQVGQVEDIVAGQINAFFGTDLNQLPDPESADTTTIGFVVTPDFGEKINNPVFSLDYYDIKIEDYISQFAAQEVLDGCYVAGLTEQCDKIVRVGGTLTLPGSGIEEFTTNLEFLQAEGLEFGFSFGIDVGNMGTLSFGGTVNKYLTQESQSSITTPVLDCLGFYGTSCGGPLPEIRWVERTTWDYADFTVSLLWRHLGDVSIEEVQESFTFDDFEHISSFDYFDLYGSYQLFEKLTLSLGVTNLFDEDPPIVGNEAADTGSNSGNTFPSHYDTLGRVISLGLNARF